MRGEGPDYGSPNVNPSWFAYVEKAHQPKPKRTTHVRIYVDTKEIIKKKAKQRSMTVPQYMRKMVEEYH
jgi:predicted DNA binding CopG/RHH family protein